MKCTDLDDAASAGLAPDSLSEQTGKPLTH